MTNQAMTHQLDIAGQVAQPEDRGAEPNSRADLFTAVLEPDAIELQRLRRELRAWLTPWGCTDSAIADVVLATSEAATNAIEHGASADGRGVSVMGTIRDGAISVVVRDHGRWRKRPLSPDRGRGLQLMHELMHDVSVDSSEHGTVVQLQLAVSIDASPTGSRNLS